MPVYLLKDNASKEKIQCDLSINTFSLEIISTVRIWILVCKISEICSALLWSDLQKNWGIYLDSWSMS